MKTHAENLVENKSSIHRCRKEYNSLVEKLSNINEDVYSEQIKNKIISYKEKYTLMPMANGRVCLICGLTPLEKQFLEEKYLLIIEEIKNLLTSIHIV